MPNVSTSMGSNPSTSYSLLDRARARDDEAWRRILELYAPLVYGWCRRMGLNEDEASDVGQNVFASVSTSLNQFRKENPEDSFRRWLKTIVRHKIIDYVESRMRRPLAQGGSDALNMISTLPAPLDVEDEAAAETERIQLLKRALEMVRGDFKPQTWTAFWRVVMDERSAAETGVELGISTNAVHLAKARVLTRLEDQFAMLISIQSSP